MSYEFRKVYADLLAEDGTFCVVYLTWLRLLGRWQGQAGVERYHPDGRRELWLGRGSIPLWGPEQGIEALPLRFETATGPAALAIEPLQGGWTPSEPCPCPDLYWQILALRTRARLDLPGGEQVAGQGYLDLVRLTRPTRLLGFRTLRWGRVHLPSRALAFMALDLADGRHWQAGVEQRGDAAPTDSSELALGLAGGAGTVAFGSGTRLELDPRRVLHQGDAFDPERIRSAVQRGVIAALGGPHGECRWLAEARCEGERALAPHELVGFGRWAARVAERGDAA